MINEITSALDRCDIAFETFNVLQKYDSKCNTSLQQCLKFCYDQRTTLALKRHDNVKLDVTVLDHKTEIEQEKNDTSRGVDRASIEQNGPNKTQTGIKSVLVSNIINSAEIPICFEKTLLMYGHGSLSNY